MNEYDWMEFSQSTSFSPTAIILDGMKRTHIFCVSNDKSTHHHHHRSPEKTLSCSLLLLLLSHPSQSIVTPLCESGKKGRTVRYSRHHKFDSSTTLYSLMASCQTVYFDVWAIYLHCTVLERAALVSGGISLYHLFEGGRAGTRHTHSYFHTKKDCGK